MATAYSTDIEKLRRPIPMSEIRVDLKSQEKRGFFKLCIKNSQNGQKLFVQLMKAQNLVPSDSNGSVNFFVKLYLHPADSNENKEYRTKTVKLSINPEWNENFDFTLKPEDSKRRLVIEVWDDKLNGRLKEVNFIGSFSFGISEILKATTSTNTNSSTNDKTNHSQKSQSAEQQQAQVGNTIELQEIRVKLHTLEAELQLKTKEHQECQVRLEERKKRLARDSKSGTYTSLLSSRNLEKLNERELELLKEVEILRKLLEATKKCEVEAAARLSSTLAQGAAPNVTLIAAPITAPAFEVANVPLNKSLSKASLYDANKPLTAVNGWFILLTKEKGELSNEPCKEPPVASVEAEAGEIIVDAGADAAQETQMAVEFAVQALTGEASRKIVEEELMPQREMVNEVLTRLQGEPLTIKDAFMSLKELKTPLLKLRVHQTLQELLVTGRYQELLCENSDVEVTPEHLMGLLNIKLEEADRHSTVEYLNDYIRRWTEQARRQNKSELEIAENVKKIESDWREQLHKKVITVGFDYDFFNKVLSQQETLSRLTPDQRDLKIKKYTEAMLDYLAGIASDEETIQYIKDEGLESIITILQKEIAEKTQSLIATNKEAWKYRTNAPVIEKDVRRRETLVNAMLLCESSLVRQHEQQMHELIETAKLPLQGNQTVDANAAVATAITTGGAAQIQEIMLPQFIEAHVRPRQNNVPLEFVFDSTVDKKRRQEAIAELSVMFEGIEIDDSDEQHAVIRVNSAQCSNIQAEFLANKEKMALLGVRLMILGEYGEIEVNKVPGACKIYSKDGRERARGYISTSNFKIYRGPEPYYAPIGWRRVAVYVGYTLDEFMDHYGDWAVAYHGTKSKFIKSILTNGLRSSTNAAGKKCCYLDYLGADAALYLSPSIEFSAHPRFAPPTRWGSQWVQLVLQVRVNPNILWTKKAGTLPGAQSTDPQLDPHFKNDELEWIVTGAPGLHLTSSNGVIVNGIMLRYTDNHPYEKPENKWWGPPDGSYWRMN